MLTAIAAAALSEVAAPSTLGAAIGGSDGSDGSAKLLGMGSSVEEAGSCVGSDPTRLVASPNQPWVWLSLVGQPVAGQPPRVTPPVLAVELAELLGDPTAWTSRLPALTVASEVARVVSIAKVTAIGPASDAEAEL